MKALGIFLPTYKRPETLQRVADNIAEATKTPHTLYFGLEKEDKEGIKAAKKTGAKVIINKYSPGYSNTIQSIYEQSDEPFFIHANDDFHFLPDWEMPALKMLKDDMDAMVIGLSDGNPQTNYWTICMIRRSYIKDRSGVVDMPDRVFFPYNHNFQDTEFTATAIARGVWRKSEGKCIEHHHPGLAQYFGPVEYDKTYHKNDDTVALDHQTYLARKHLWESPTA